MNRDGELFIPNVTDEILGNNNEVIPGLELYEQRLIPLIITSKTKTDTNNIICMSEDNKDPNKELYRIYKELGIPMPPEDDIIYINGGGNLSENILGQIKYIIKYIEGKGLTKTNPFIHSKQNDKIASQLGLSTSRNNKASEIINNKGYAQNELRKLGVLTPEGKIVKDEKSAIDYFNNLQNKGYGVISFKITRSASGQGVFTVRNEKELEKLLKKYSNELLKREILMDGWIEGEKISDPNIQFYVGKTQKDDKFISCSDQFMGGKDNKVHLGNISNISILKNNKKLAKDVNIILDWIRKNKGYGIVGLDFSIFKEESGEEKAYFMEINGRVNGSTHGAVISNILQEENKHDWGIANNIYLPKHWTINNFISQLEKDGIYYNPETKKGVFPSNIATINTVNKVMVTIFGNNNEVNSALDILAKYKDLS